MAIPWGWVNRPFAPETEPNDLKCKIPQSPDHGRYDPDDKTFFRLNEVIYRGL